jgi:hypothetical protein
MNMATLSPLAPTGREYITGTFSFVLTSNNQTVVTFMPSRVLRKNTTYNVLLLGASGSLISNEVRNPAYEGMADSYEWSFTTGTVDVTVPPTRSLRPVRNETPRARRRSRHRLRPDSLLLLAGQDQDDGLAMGGDPLCSSVARPPTSSRLSLAMVLVSRMDTLILCVCTPASSAAHSPNSPSVGGGSAFTWEKLAPVIPSTRRIRVSVGFWTKKAGKPVFPDEHRHFSTHPGRFCDLEPGH